MSQCFPLEDEIHQDEILPETARLDSRKPLNVHYKTITTVSHDLSVFVPAINRL